MKQPNKITEIKKKPSEMGLLDKLSSTANITRLERLRVCDFFGLSPSSSLNELREFALKHSSLIDDWDQRNKKLDIYSSTTVSKDIEIKSNRIEDELSNLILLGVTKLKKEFNNGKVELADFVDYLNKLSNLYKNLSFGKQGRARATKIIKPDIENFDNASKIELNFGDTDNDNDDKKDKGFDSGEL